ncbi:hypothetical protein B0T25DRAFT_55081 [Lasiosphaeria hispida]|uniref:Uncharacterized protein n=1 Tax=Lasiosphaeria hispida TaxID=260671 RepID=A0AAJ0HW86_9PEZI|nr:hypothetical protein B0T25DRAFT_55081 [Lasiosphaeria hispida]
MRALPNLLFLLSAALGAMLIALLSPVGAVTPWHETVTISAITTTTATITTPAPAPSPRTIITIIPAPTPPPPPLIPVGRKTGPNFI